MVSKPENNGREVSIQDFDAGTGRRREVPAAALVRRATRRNLFGTFRYHVKMGGQVASLLPTNLILPKVRRPPHSTLKRACSLQLVHVCCCCRVPLRERDAVAGCACASQRPRLAAPMEFAGREGAAACIHLDL